MKQNIPSSMQTDLENGATHHCVCWRVQRLDDSVLGFTDHDRDLVFDGVTFKAETGLTPSAIQQSSGLNVDNMDVMGMLNAMSIDESDIAAGLYDRAYVTAYRVDWRDVSKRFILLSGSVGEISRGSMGFTAEVRGLAHYFNQATGEAYLPTCRVDLGSPKCGIDFEASSASGHPYQITSEVTAVRSKASFVCNQPEVTARPDGWFTRGLIIWTSGNNQTQQMEVKVHSSDGINSIIGLWIPMPFEIQVGDTFVLRTGCDKAASTCHAKFNNLANFRGFNLIPGNDIVLQMAKQGDDNSGQSIFSTL